MVFEWFDDPLGMITGKCVHSDGTLVLDEDATSMWQKDSKITELLTVVQLSLPL